MISRHSHLSRRVAVAGTSPQEQFRRNKPSLQTWIFEVGKVENANRCQYSLLLVENHDVNSIVVLQRWSVTEPSMKKNRTADN